jgi:hypothetical protein
MFIFLDAYISIGKWYQNIAYAVAAIEARVAQVQVLLIAPVLTV